MVSLIEQRDHALPDMVQYKHNTTSADMHEKNFDRQLNMTIKQGKFNATASYFK